MMRFHNGFIICKSTLVVGRTFGHMELTHEETAGKGVFRLVDGSTEAGHMTYHMQPDGRMNIDHTETSQAYAGQGLAKRLVLAGAEHARTNRLMVRPTCPCALKVLSAPEFADILKV